ncbi:hypothetical protein HJG60_009460 [Phyllostomus discolor]|uniref:Uncharacterized protein n=1 Tax=Phyllostomus discolor TaxID=89673 RepID=A0A833YJ56_9CHIR|nr:hypothetical protein HJG60_009460 [Phyllostomus discolor]
MSFSVSLHRGRSIPFTQQKPAVQVPQDVTATCTPVPCPTSQLGPHLHVRPASPAAQGAASPSLFLSRTRKWSSPVSASRRSHFAHGGRVPGGDTSDSREQSPSAQAGRQLRRLLAHLRPHPCPQPCPTWVRLSPPILQTSGQRSEGPTSMPQLTRQEGSRART